MVVVSSEPCPHCGNQQTHAEQITDLTVITSNPAQITIYHCPDCGQVWQVQSTVSKERNNHVSKGR